MGQLLGLGDEFQIRKPTKCSTPLTSLSLKMKFEAQMAKGEAAINLNLETRKRKSMLCGQDMIANR